MKQLADGVWQVGGFPPNAINVYVIEDVLIDAASRHATRRILRGIDGHPITAHALTHAHPDHQGASHAVCERLAIPFWVGERDVDAAEDPEPDRHAPAQPPDRRRSLTARSSARAIPSTAASPRATSSPASRCSTCPGTRPATSPSGASPTASSSSATCSTT